jgi:hypothetical protein
MTAAWTSARLNTLGAEGSKYELVAWVFKRFWGALYAAKLEPALRPQARIRAEVANAFFMVISFNQWLDISGQVGGREALACPASVSRLFVFRLIDGVNCTPISKIKNHLVSNSSLSKMK